MQSANRKNSADGEIAGLKEAAVSGFQGPRADTTSKQGGKFDNGCDSGAYRSETPRILRKRAGNRERGLEIAFNRRLGRGAARWCGLKSVPQLRNTFSEETQGDWSRIGSSPFACEAQLRSRCSRPGVTRLPQFSSFDDAGRDKGSQGNKGGRDGRVLKRKKKVGRLDGSTIRSQGKEGREIRGERSNEPPRGRDRNGKPVSRPGGKEATNTLHL